MWPDSRRQLGFQVFLLAAVIVVGVIVLILVGGSHGAPLYHGLKFEVYKSKPYLVSNLTFYSGPCWPTTSGSQLPRGEMVQATSLILRNPQIPEPSVRHHQHPATWGTRCCAELSGPTGVGSASQRSKKFGVEGLKGLGFWV